MRISSSPALNALTKTMPKIVRTIEEWQALQATYRAAGQSVGFVPTMGALHEGHLALCRAARQEHDIVLVSIFVNPTQFDEPQDFAAYPRTLESDAETLSAAGVDVIFAPSVEEMYPNGQRYAVVENELSRELCGAHRPGHFSGMLTVVLKLLQIAGADAAYFGEKDFQQLLLVRGLAQAFFVPTRIVACPTVREPDGLAMSSRNARLTPQQRLLAPRLHAVLTTAPTATDAREQLAAAGFLVDYVEDRDGRRFGAVRLGSTRLIDNVPR